METVAILPAHNLEDSIEEIVKRTKRFVDLVILVSDGSNDNTNLKARTAGAECPPHSNVRGKGFAIRKGIEFTKRFNPRYIILMDADGQHMPEEIPKLIAPLKDGKADMVIGSRMKGKLRTSPINKIGNYLLKLISFAVTGRWFTDTESGFKVFIAKKLYGLNLNSKKYEIEGEILLKSLQKGYNIIELPITVPYAVPGITVMDGVKMGIYKLKTGLKLKIG